MFADERKRLTENSAAQHERQLGFIDQLIKDKQGLAEQVTNLVKKIENDESARNKERQDTADKHKGTPARLRNFILTIINFDAF